VRLSAQMVAQALETAPRSWLLKPRGGHTSPLELKDGNSYFGTGSDVLFVRDPDTHERRRVRKADVEGMAALCERLPNIDFVMSMGLPEDVPQAVDDLAQVEAMLCGTCKPLLVAPRNGFVLPRIREMAALCGEAESFAIYAMPSPPLMHDEDALSKLMVCAELEIPLVYAPAPCAGTTAPASVAAAIVVANAEVLSGLVLHPVDPRRGPLRVGRRRGRHEHAQHGGTCTPRRGRFWATRRSATWPAGMACRASPMPVTRTPRHSTSSGAPRRPSRPCSAPSRGDSAARRGLPGVRPAKLLRVDHAG